MKRGGGVWFGFQGCKACFFCVLACKACLYVQTLTKRGCDGGRMGHDAGAGGMGHGRATPQGLRVTGATCVAWAWVLCFLRPVLAVWVWPASPASCSSRGVLSCCWGI